MKRKILLVISISAMMMLALVGCSVKKSGKRDYDPQEYIEIGEYKGIIVNIPDLKFEEKDVIHTMHFHLSSAGKDLISYKDVERTSVEDGDLVDIDFTGFHKGEAFEGGTSKNYMLEIGKGQFIEGFEEGLVGAEIGKEVTLNLKFPEVYHTEELSGEDVVFKVIVNKLQEIVYGDITDEIVEEYTEYKTFDQYEEVVRTAMEDTLEEKNRVETINQSFIKIQETSKVKSFPENLLENHKNEINAFYKEYAKEKGLDFENLAYNYIAESEEEYKEKVNEMAEERIIQALIVETIVEKEDIKLSKKEFKQGVEKLIGQYGEDKGIKTAEDLYKVMSKDEIIDSLLWEKTLGFIADNAEIVME